MGNGTSIRKQRFERLTIIVVSLIAFAFVASYLTENPEVSLLLPIVAVLSNIINILNWINEPIDHDENRRLAIADAFDLVMEHEGIDAETRTRIRDTVVEPAEPPSTQSDITETHDTSETNPAFSNVSAQKTDSERVNEMKESSHWHPHSPGYPRGRMAILRLMDQLLKQLSISNQTHDMAWRVVMGCGIFAYFWFLLMALQMLDTWLLILPEAVESIVYLVPAPSSTLTSILYLLVPVSIIVTATMTFTARRETTCPHCETPFALKWIGTYYQDGDRLTRTKTDMNGNKYTVTTVHAKQVLQCTQKKCEEYTIQDIAFYEQ